MRCSPFGLAKPSSGQSVLFGNYAPTSEGGQGPAAKRVTMGIEPKPVRRKFFLYTWMLSKSGKSNSTNKAVYGTKPKDGRRAPKEGAKSGYDETAK